MDINYYKQYEPIFGVWHIARLIGEGSFGKVFELERDDFGVHYKAALKAITIPASQSEVDELMAEMTDEASVRDYYSTFIRELVEESALMSRLKGNSNIVSYENHQVIEHKGGIGWDVLIQMELLTPLNLYTKEHTITRQDIIRLGIDMCKALELCQKFNIIHRDLKPENIFISEGGDFKLGDFGIARTVEKTTGGLSKKGTYNYMAPEVYKGESYGSTVDIYSLGIVLYRLLNENRTPFLPAYPAPITHRDRENALSKRFSGAPLPPPIHGDGRLGEIVLKACSYNSKERYSSPVQMRQELEAILYNQKEASYIYPEGDQVDQKSVEYAATGEEVQSPHYEGTQWDSSVSGTQGTVSGFGATQGGTVSDFGTVRTEQTASGFDTPPRTQSMQASNSYNQNMSQSVVQSEPKRRNAKLLIGIGCAALALCGVLIAEIGPFVIRTVRNASLTDGNTISSASENTVPSVSQSGVGARTETDIFSDGSYSIYEYDENGILIKSSYYSADGTLHKVYFYDKLNNLIREETYDEDGELSDYYTAEYDSDGNRTRGCHYNGNGTMSYSLLYEYDAAGNKIKETTYYYEDGIVNEYDITECEYDTAGNKIKETMCLYYDDGTTLYNGTEYEYDTAGNKIKETTYHGKDRIVFDITEYEYDTAGNKIKETMYNYEDGIVSWYRITEYEYDTAENMINETGYLYEDDVASLYYIAEYEYDTAGNIIKETMYNYEDGIVNEYDIIECEYDTAGNMIKKTMYVYSKDGVVSCYYITEYDKQGNQVSDNRYDVDDTLEDVPEVSGDNDDTQLDQMWGKVWDRIEADLSNQEFDYSQLGMSPMEYATYLKQNNFRFADEHYEDSVEPVYNKPREIWAIPNTEIDLNAINSIFIIATVENPEAIGHIRYGLYNGVGESIQVDYYTVALNIVKKVAPMPCGIQFGDNFDTIFEKLGVTRDMLDWGTDVENLETDHWLVKFEQSINEYLDQYTCGELSLRNKFSTSGALCEIIIRIGHDESGRKTGDLYLYYE